MSQEGTIACLDGGWEILDDPVHAVHALDALDALDALGESAMATYSSPAVVKSPPTPVPTDEAETGAPLPRPRLIAPYTARSSSPVVTRRCLAPKNTQRCVQTQTGLLGSNCCNWLRKHTGILGDLKMHN